MSQSDKIAAYLQGASITSPKAISAALGLPYDNVSALLSQMKKRGLVERANPGEKLALYALAAKRQDVDDPSMIPVGPPPRCETRALAADEGADEETPTARAIAVAVTASAASLGEDPTQIAIPGAWLRCRFAAAKALRMFYPDCTWEQVGRYVGFIKLSAKAIENAEATKWWPEDGAQALDAAIQALEHA